MYQDTDTVIVAASRTAIGSFNGSFRDVAPYKLGSAVIQSLLGKINMKASDIDEVILGQILTAGQGQNPARQAAIDAGIPFETPAWLINQLCASGLRSVIIAHQQIKEDFGRILIAGGQESMTQAPHVSYIRQGQKMGALQMQDTMISDALIDFFNNYHMGVTAENVADRWSISRDAQDKFAFDSQMKAAKAQDDGKFIDEICPVHIEQKKNKEIVLEDEYIRKNISMDDIASLNTIFKKEGGTVIYSTHNLSEAEKVCDRILILHNGQLRFDGSPKNLMSETSTLSLEEGYVQLTSDDARIRDETEPEGWFSKAWRQLFTRKTNLIEEIEDE